MNSDIQALRNYVMGPSSQNQSESTVRLSLTHSNLKAKFMEVRLDLHLSIDSVKSKLCFHCGTPPSAMLLELRNDHNVLVAQLTDPQRMLGYYSPQDGFIIHIIDVDPTSLSANGWLEDVSKVEKYTMSEEDYSKRENTYRRYKEDKLREDPHWTLARELAARRGQPLPEAAKPKQEDYLEEEAATIELGSRCEVEGGKRGLVQYVGKVEGLPMGLWVGVQYDEPVGKNDGSIKGHRYFDCHANYGGFVRPHLVKTGDYPPFDEEFEFDESDEI